MVRHVLLATLLVLPGALTLPLTQAACMNLLRPGITLTMLGVSLPSRALPRHRWTPLPALGPDLPRAALASEDARFYAHRGFDRQGICAAFRHNRSRGGLRGRGGGLRGGSTISQQTARNLFLWQGRSWLRKGLETWYTLALEATVPKDRILELYLNVAELGPSVYGVEAAAQHWYRQPAAQLGPERAARLVALLPSPRTRRPDGAIASRKAAWIRANPAPMPGDRSLESVQAALAELPWWPPCPVPPQAKAR